MACSFSRRSSCRTPPNGSLARTTSSADGSSPPVTLSSRTWSDSSASARRRGEQVVTSAVGHPQGRLDADPRRRRASTAWKRRGQPVLRRVPAASTPGHRATRLETRAAVRRRRARCDDRSDQVAGRQRELSTPGNEPRRHLRRHRAIGRRRDVRGLQRRPNAHDTSHCLGWLSTGRGRSRAHGPEAWLPLSLPVRYRTWHVGSGGTSD